MRGSFVIGQLLIAANGLIAVFDRRSTDVAIYIFASFVIYGLGRIEQTLREHR